jgi:hypothetical protein
MPNNLRSTTSKQARKRKRGESEEDYAKRIARIESKRLSEAKRRQKGVVSEIQEETPARLGSAKHIFLESSTTKSSPVVERFLEQHTADLTSVSAEVEKLRRMLADERRERERLQREIAIRDEVVNHRNHVAEQAHSIRSHFSGQSVEIVDLSSPRGQEHTDHEIIDLFEHDGQVPEIVSTIVPNHAISNELSASPGHQERDPTHKHITLRDILMGRATHRPVWGSGESGGERQRNPEQTKNDPRIERPMTLAEAAEKLLWVGWVDRARRELPSAPLLVRFGGREQRAWSDVVASTAEFVGCENLDVVCDPIPFALELTWTLRYALDSLPAASPVLDVCWRYISSFMKPQPRARLGVYAGTEKLEVVKKRFEAVELEIATGALVIQRGDF